MSVLLHVLYDLLYQQCGESIYVCVQVRMSLFLCVGEVLVLKLNSADTSRSPPQSSSPVEGAESTNANKITTINVNRNLAVIKSTVGLSLWFYTLSFNYRF